MEAYRYQELGYLVVPVMLGIEFLMCAKDERRNRSAVETKKIPPTGANPGKAGQIRSVFFFMGAWWQVYIFGALRARRMKKKVENILFL